MDERALRTLLESMSLAEKVGQLIQFSGEFYGATDISVGPQHKLGVTKEMVGLSGSVLNVAGAKATRKLQDWYMAQHPHHIPLLFMSDIIYGYRTVYPVPLGIGASWDPELVETAYANTADEAQAGGSHVSFAPMVDLVRDARWGRVLESPGEDPFLNTQMAKAMVRGFQHDLAHQRGIASCVKHFAAYGAVEGGREYNGAQMAPATLFQDYLPAYKGAVEAGAKMMMTSLSTLNGVPGTADTWLLQTILRERWGFDGVIISDYASIYELVQHGFAKDAQDASFKALTAGVDIDMKSPCYANELAPLLENGRLDETKIDQAVWRVLQLKNTLGLFEDPYRGASEAAEAATLLSADKRQVARQLSRESLVLLKNYNQVLPLTPHSDQKVALVGPYAARDSLLGMWAVHGHKADTVTLAQGVAQYSDHLSVGQATDIVRDAEMFKGMGATDAMLSQVIQSDAAEEAAVADTLAKAQAADVIVFVAGEHTLQSGEAGSRGHLRLPDNQRQLLKQLRQLGKPVVLVVISGRPLVLTDVVDDVDAIVQAWFPGSEGGNAIADVLFGAYNPSGRLSMTFPADEGQLPIYYNHPSTGRPEGVSQHSSRFTARYIDIPSEPLFAFGAGLSYGKVDYTAPVVDVSELRPDQPATVTVTLHNGGELPVTETVQCYLHQAVASIVQPVKRLVDFKRVTLEPGASQTVTFTIQAEQCAFYGNDGQLRLESSPIQLYVGHDSTTKAHVALTLKVKE